MRTNTQNIRYLSFSKNNFAFPLVYNSGQKHPSKTTDIVIGILLLATHIINL